MPRPRAQYGTSELELLKRNLPDILTIEQDALSTLLRQHPDEVNTVFDVFMSVSDQLHHKWQDVVLAKVPVSSWTPGPGNTLHISPSRSASLRYLAREALPAEKSLKLVQARRALLEGLLTQMDTSSRLAYRSMLRWVDADKFGAAEVSQFPLSSDSAFGYNLVFLENLLSEQIFIYDQNWRKEEKLAVDEATPCVVTHASSLMALEHLGSIIEGWLAEADDLPSTVPESLLARISANLSVNRALLELAATEALGLEAAQMNVPFLDELNRHGVTTVPATTLDCSPDEAEQCLRNQLTSWFAHGGSLVSSSDYFNRYMTNSDIEMVVSWSQKLQQQYVSSRGRQGGLERAQEAHSNPGNRFIFAMAMVAAFYCKTRTAHELTGNSNSTYAVFPVRGKTANDKQHEPPPHAAQLLLQAYGQMFFANSEWNLHAEQVREYAETTSVKRSHVQQLLSFAVKNRTSRELLALHTNLQHHHEAAMAKC